MEKLIWEFLLTDGWHTVGDYNLDGEGNLKGFALEAKNDGVFGIMFRQTPESQIGKGDSTGKVKIMLEVDDEI